MPILGYMKPILVCMCVCGVCNVPNQALWMCSKGHVRLCMLIVGSWAVSHAYEQNRRSGYDI